MNIYPLAADRLRAALLSASAEATRHYLNGVLLDPTGFIVSTDGHRAFVSQAPALIRLPAAIIVPRGALAAFLKGTKLTEVLVIEEGGKWTLSDDRGWSVGFSPVDGVFPDWQRLVPAGGTEGAPAHYNPAYYADLGKVAKLVSGNASDFEIMQAGGGPAAVLFGNVSDCFAVIMPMRTEGREWNPARMLTLATQESQAA